MAQHPALVVEHLFVGSSLPSHPSIQNLPACLTFQGKYEEAGDMWRRSLYILENALGAYHPEVATTLNNLAGLVESQVRAVGML